MENRKEIKDYVYKVITSSGSGSAFNVKGHPYIVTNWHVVQGHQKVAIERPDKSRYLGDVVMVNPHKDIALISVSELSQQDSPIELDENLVVENGQTVHIGGYPYGMPFTVTKGIISSAEQLLDGQTFVQTDAAVNSGNSGGVMFNEESKLIGVIASKFTDDADNIGFAIPHLALKDELDSYKFQEEKFRVRCHSCGGYLEEKSKFCQDCGGSIKEGLFDEPEPTFLEKIVNQSLQNVDLMPILCTIGSERWEFYYEKILIRLFKSSSTIFATYSPLCKLPKGNIEELLKELTSNKYKTFKIGIERDNNAIVIFYRFYLTDLNLEHHRDEIIKNLSHYIESTKELSDYFIEKYGCEKIKI